MHDQPTVTRLRAGLYRHESGWMITRTSDLFEGPRGGVRHGWEVATDHEHGFSVDDWTADRTLRAAVRRLERDLADGVRGDVRLPLRHGDYVLRPAYSAAGIGTRFYIARRDPDRRERTIAVVRDFAEWDRFASAIERGLDEVAAVRGMVRSAQDQGAHGAPQTTDGKQGTR